MGRNQASNLDPPAVGVGSDGKIADLDEPRRTPRRDDEEREDADANQDQNSVECVNITSHTVKFEIHGVRYVLKSKQVIQLHRAYALPRKMHRNRDAVPSVVEMVTAKQVLACSDPRAQQVMMGIG